MLLTDFFLPPPPFHLALGGAAPAPFPPPYAVSLSKVSFELNVPVTHWNSGSKVSVRVVKGMKLNDFKVQVRLMFSSEDMSSVNFRVYRFPFNFSCVSQRSQISNDSDFDSCVEQLWDLTVFPPELYVWNVVDGEGVPSPTLLPLITD